MLGLIVGTEKKVGPLPCSCFDIQTKNNLLPLIYFLLACMHLCFNRQFMHVFYDLITEMPTKVN